ncbi:cytochrome P450 [Nocardia sp. NPDC004604]|uniref:cytochrome P450 n=1 Tax=Nocardia sp. NPDC004604 TaxID=3157013 RepID=UPI0033A7D02F
MKQATTFCAEVEQMADNFDPWSSEFANDAEFFWAVVNRMREKGAVLRSEKHGGFWVITRYKEVMRANKDWETFTSAQGATIPHNPDVAKLAPIEVDPPAHHDWRRMLNPLMSPSAVAQHEPAMRRIARGLMDEFVESGECDLAKDFAWRYVPSSLFELMLGVPPDQLPATRALVQDFISAEDLARQQVVFADLEAWSKNFLLWRKESTPRDDVTNALLGGQVGGKPLTIDEMASALILLLLAGMETTSSSIGNIAGHLIEDPALGRYFATPGTSVDLAVEELLRRGSVSFGLSRVATRDVEIAGQVIPAGGRILLLWAAANWDPSVFPQPERFDLDRPPGRHLAFGAGPHKCMGANFARLMVKTAATEIVARMPDLRLRPGSVVEHPPGLVRSTRSMRVIFRPTPRSTTSATTDL